MLHIAKYMIMDTISLERKYILVLKRAFTLSEVLITLSIIGVVAAITMPTLIADWHKTQTVSQLLKVHSTINQTAWRAIADNGPIDTWPVETMTAKEFYTTYLKPYLNVMKDDESNTFEYTALNGKKDAKTDGLAFYLIDGAKVFVQTPQNTEWGIEVEIYIDINGDKKPNRMARDIFTFNYWIYNPTKPELIGKLIPWGADWTRDEIKNSSVDYACNKQKTGEICAALIVQDGWQIKEDYPW